MTRVTAATTARRAATLAVAWAAMGAAPIPAQQTFDEATAGTERQDGYFPLYWHAEKGTLLMEVGRLDEPFLYLTSLATGIGSNRLGLDRGMIGNEAVARFTRVGPRVMLILDNPAFRAAGTDNPALARSVEESFPTSTVGAFDVMADEDGRALIDVTGFLMQDVMDVAGRLRQTDQGNFSLDRGRSAVYLPGTRAFPINTELEVSLTFASAAPGPEVRRHTPDGRALTVRQHHSFVRLPDGGFRPRPFDPRIGLFTVGFFDFSRSLEEGYASRYAIRHRLVKRNPGRAVSDPVEPIVYYLDRGVPEPYRTAFKEGTMWYADLFRHAGFSNAFRIEDMPEDMDPLDARYNVIQWVHRTEAGSSIGPSFVDPRTGEIIKAAVRMDSHRSLVDYNLYAGALPALGPDEAASLFAEEAALGEWIASQDPRVSAEEFAMARRRQHAAHEVGHTLGLAHNFVAASYGRASVMDYPAPLITVDAGAVSVADAYRDGPGAYDSVAIRYGYAEFEPAEEARALRAIADEATARGLEFITNPDENPAGSYPEATTWINGSDALAELERLMDVRRTLIDRFDATAIREGEPMYLLDRRFAAVYLHHRFGVTAATKAVGGMKFHYALRGDGVPPTEIVPARRQRDALALLLRVLRPADLAVPERVLRLMAPRPFGFRDDERAFASRAGPAFDQLGIAKTLTRMVVSGLLHPSRMARVAAFHDRDAELPALEEVVGALVDGTWGQAAGEHAAVRRARDRVVLDELIVLGTSRDATGEARAAAAWGIRRIENTIAEEQAADPAEEAHRLAARRDAERFFEAAFQATPATAPLSPPPGTPIGDPGRGR